MQEEWLRSAAIRREIELDTFVVMPNHLHGIIVLIGTHGVRPRPGVRSQPGVRPRPGMRPWHLDRENPGRTGVDDKDEEFLRL